MPKVAEIDRAVRGKVAEVVDKVAEFTEKIQEVEEAKKLSVPEKNKLIAELKVLDDNLVAVFCKDNQGEKRAIAMGILYERMIDRIYNYLYYRMGNQQDAEDLTSKVFFKVLDKIDTYQNTGVPFSAWVYRIAHNLLANWRRDRSKIQEVAEEVAVFEYSRDPSPHQSAEKKERIQALMAAIRRLSDERQQLVLLKFSDQYTNREIGKIMGRSEGAIKSMYHRTMEELREYMR